MGSRFKMEPFRCGVHMVIKSFDQIVSAIRQKQACHINDFQVTFAIAEAFNARSNTQAVGMLCARDRKFSVDRNITASESKLAVYKTDHDSNGSFCKERAEIF